MTRRFRFNGYDNGHIRDYQVDNFVVGHIYEARNFDDYYGDKIVEPDAEFLVNGKWEFQNLCFFTEIFDEQDWVDAVSEPSPAELAQMNASAEELRFQFEG